MKNAAARILIIMLLVSACLLTARARQSGLTQNPPESEEAEDEPDFIVPSRPTVSNPAEFHRPGVLQLEFGYNSNFRAAGIRTEQDAPLALRFAASRRVLLEFDGDNPLSQRTSDGVRATGAGDTQLGIQAVLRHQSKTKPGVALAYYIKLPTASTAKGLGTGRVDHNFIALVSKNIGKATVDFNAVYLLAGRTGSGGHAASGQAALAISHGVTRLFGLQGELSGYSRNDQQPGAVFILGAVTYQLNRRLVLDGGLRSGLTMGSARGGAFAGLTIGLADLYRKRPTWIQKIPKRNDHNQRN
jgi:hypothetical protein